MAKGLFRFDERRPRFGSSFDALTRDALTDVFPVTGEKKRGGE